MTNSLSKDSHITRTCRLQKSTYSSERRVYNSMNNTAPVYNSSIIVKKPAEISFSGLSSSSIANDSTFKILVNAARDIIGKEKSKYRDVVTLISNSVKSLVDKEGKVILDENTKTFVDSHKLQLQDIIDKAREFTKEDSLVKIPDPKDPKNKIVKLINGKPEYRLESKELESEAIKSIGLAAEAFPAVEKPHKIYTSNWVHGALLSAEKNNVAFSAAFALLLTCLVRPASIMALPGGKKNKDDKKYASAHSIASGIIGYIISTAVSTPLAKAVKKVLENPVEYAPLRNGAYFEASKKASEVADAWLLRSVDVLMAVPKGIITIALIPIILKYVFGWEKKNPNKDNPQLVEKNNNNSTNIKFQKSMEVSK